MKVALFVGFVFFCSLWTIGSFRQCSSCSSSISYDDCQSKLKVTNCTNDDGGCFHADVKAEKGSDKTHAIQKGCVSKSLCAEYNEGKIGDCTTQRAQGYAVDCKVKCCTSGDECNKGDLLANSSFRQCSSCSSSVSYDDCQSKLKVKNCTNDDDGCSQVEIKSEKGSDKKYTILKDCVGKSVCAEYNNGDIEFCKTQKALGYTVESCKSKCCTSGDECNKDNLLANKGSAFIISAMVLFSGLLLTLVNIN